MEFTFVFEGKALKSPDRYKVDQYGNRFMIFSDGNGNKFQISRDALDINVETRICTQRNKEIHVVKL